MYKCIASFKLTDATDFDYNKYYKTKAFDKNTILWITENCKRSCTR